MADSISGDPKPASMSDVAKALGFGAGAEKAAAGMSLQTFRNEWQALTDQDKTDLKTGVGNGTLTY